MTPAGTGADAAPLNAPAVAPAAAPGERPVALAGWGGDGSVKAAARSVARLGANTPTFEVFPFTCQDGAAGKCTRNTAHASTYCV